MLFQTFITTSHYVILILLSTLVSKSICLNALFISAAGAGHVTPMFELAKAMKNHNVTFLTRQIAKSYIDLNSYSSPLFRIIYANDSADAISYDKNIEQKLILTIANQSLLDAFPTVALALSNFITPLLHKTINILMHDRFDVIVAGSMVFGIPVLCEKIQVPCVIQSPSVSLNIIDLNLPNTLSLLTSKELTQLTYRIYNAAFTAHLTIKMIS
jgi:hypothetical protein